jgi:hypothetical protein
MSAKDSFPLGNGSNGGENQDARGRFVKGNKAAVGRATPRQKKRQKFHDVIDATSPKAFMAVWAGVLAAATGDDPEPWAVRLVMELLVGNRIERENAVRLEAIEAAMGFADPDTPCQSDAA